MVFILWFADAILFKATNILIDAVIVQNIHDEFKFSDVHLQDVLHLEEGPRLDFTADAILNNRFNNNYTLDGFLQQDANLLPFTIDANAQIMPSKNYSVDAFLQKTDTTTSLVDAVIVDRFLDEPIVDAVVVRRPLNTFLIDPITIGTLENTPLVDAQLQVNDRETTFLVDGVPEIIPEVRPRVDAYIQDTFEVAYLVDGRVILRPNNDFTIDASVQKDGFKPFNVDAFLLDVFDLVASVDAILELPQGDIDVCTIHFCTPTQPAVFFGVDAVIIEPVAFQWTIDAHIEDLFATSFGLDALLVTQFDHVFTLDASLILPSQFNACPSLTRQTLNCTSVIRRRGT